MSWGTYKCSVGIFIRRWEFTNVAWDLQISVGIFKCRVAFINVYICI